MKIPISSKVVFFMRSDVFLIISINGLVLTISDPGKLFSLDKTSKDSKKEILFSLALSIINLTDWFPILF